MILLKNINKRYFETIKQQQIIFESVSFDFSDHNFIGIMGRSGSGKTTLLNILSGLDIDYSGEYIFDGEEMEKSKHFMGKFRLFNVSYVSQNYRLLTDRSVLENTALPLYCRKMKRNRARTEALNALSMVGVSHLANKNPKKISGGEAQRVAIAGALVKKPKIILADEPTGALDEETEHEIMMLFKKISNDIKLIIATHSNDVTACCDAVYKIKDKIIVRQS